MNTFTIVLKIEYILPILGFLVGACLGIYLKKLLRPKIGKEALMIMNLIKKYGLTQAPNSCLNYTLVKDGVGYLNFTPSYGWISTTDGTYIEKRFNWRERKRIFKEVSNLFAQEKIQKKLEAKRKTDTLMIDLETL